MSKEKDFMTFEFGEGEFKFEEFNEEKPTEKMKVNIDVDFNMEDVDKKINEMFNKTEEKLMSKFSELITKLKGKYTDESAQAVIAEVENFTEPAPITAPAVAPIVSVDFKESDEYKAMVAKQLESDARIAKMQEDARRKDWDNFCDGIINTALTATETKAAKLLPASVASVKIMANTLYSQYTAEFSEAVKIDETPAAKALSSFLEGLPDQKLFGTQATNEGHENVVTSSKFSNLNVDENRLAAYTAVCKIQQEFADKGKTISYEEALDIYTEQN